MLIKHVRSKYVGAGLLAQLYVEGWKAGFKSDTLSKQMARRSVAEVLAAVARELGVEAERLRERHRDSGLLASKRVSPTNVL